MASATASVQTLAAVGIRDVAEMEEEVPERRAGGGDNGFYFLQQSLRSWDSV